MATWAIHEPRGLAESQLVEGQSLEGELWKLSDQLRQWRRRWFVLHRGAPRLLYKIRQRDASLRGTIPLVDASVGVLSSPASHPTWCCFYIRGPMGSHHLAAESQQAAHRWMELLSVTAAGASLQSQSLQPGHAMPPLHPPSYPPPLYTPPQSHVPPSHGKAPNTSSSRHPPLSPSSPTHTAPNPLTATISSANVAECEPHGEKQHNGQPQQQQQHEQQRQQQHQEQQQQQQGRAWELRPLQQHSVEQWVIEATCATGVAIPASLAAAPDMSLALDACRPRVTAAGTTARPAAAASPAVREASEPARCDSLSDDDGAFESPRSDSFLSLCSDADWSTPASAFATPMLAASTPVLTGSTPIVAGSTPTYRGRAPTVAAITARLARLSPSLNPGDVARVTERPATVKYNPATNTEVSAASMSDGWEFTCPAGAAGSRQAATFIASSSNSGGSSRRNQMDPLNVVSRGGDGRGDDGRGDVARIGAVPREPIAEALPEGEGVSLTACEHHPLEIGSEMQASSLAAAAAEAADDRCGSNSQDRSVLVNGARSVLAGGGSVPVSTGTTSSHHSSPRDASHFEPSLLAVLAESRGLGHAAAFADVVGFFGEGGEEEEEEEEEATEGHEREFSALQDDELTGEQGVAGEGEGDVEREGLGGGGEGRKQPCEAAEGAGSGADGRGAKAVGTGSSAMRQCRDHVQGELPVDVWQTDSAPAEALPAGDLASEPAAAEPFLPQPLPPGLPSAGLVTGASTAAAISFEPTQKSSPPRLPSEHSLVTTSSTAAAISAVHSDSVTATASGLPSLRYSTGFASLPSSPTNTVMPPMLTWTELSPSQGVSEGVLRAEPSAALRWHAGQSNASGMEMGRERRGGGEARGGGVDGEEGGEGGGEEGSEGSRCKRTLQGRCRDKDAQIVNRAERSGQGMGGACRLGAVERGAEAGRLSSRGRGSGAAQAVVASCAGGDSGRNGRSGGGLRPKEEIWRVFRWGWPVDGGTAREESSSQELQALLRLQLRFERAMTQLMNCQVELQAKDQRISSLEAQVSSLQDQVTRLEGDNLMLRGEFCAYERD
ncbi:hypothetical protein CLOM_g9533 [Closterium sp. NIES-68]|nr:hypothetical protein CLOM_g9533 [Closterium sp. NIES-68]GJP65600.1 hypothetical protein CLOP_g22472 [Closterium sp. NIES-67]